MPDTEIRLARLEGRIEERFKSIDEKLDHHQGTNEAILETLETIKIGIANEAGRRSALRYVAHAASVAAGGLAGILGGKLHLGSQ